MFKGSLVAIVTPMDEEGGLDLERFRLFLTSILTRVPMALW